MVFAQTPPVPGAPVVVVYGHYDVQPVEPLDQWISGPFEPTIRDGNLYARGATDDKGQVLTHVQSVCQWLASGRPLPLQIKFLIEGEEEVGSESLERMLPELRDRLACDCVVISDSGQYADGQPAITYGLRGIATYELRVDGPSQDLHSGSFGGAVMNPAIALCHLLSSSSIDRDEFGSRDSTIRCVLWRIKNASSGKRCRKMMSSSLRQSASISYSGRKDTRRTNGDGRGRRLTSTV